MKKGRFLIIICSVFLIWFGSDIHATNLLSADKNKSDYSDSLKVWENLLTTTGFKYSYRGEKRDVGMGGSRIKVIVQDVPEALKEIKTFGNYQVPSFILTIASGIAVGFGIAAKIDGDHKTANPLLIGGGSALVVAFTLDRIGYSHLKKGVKIFNQHQSGGK